MRSISEFSSFPFSNFTSCAQFVRRSTIGIKMVSKTLELLIGFRLTIFDMIMIFYFPTYWLIFMHHTKFGFAAGNFKKWFRKWNDRNLEEKVPLFYFKLPNCYALPESCVVGCRTFFVCVTIVGFGFGTSLVGVSWTNGLFWRTWACVY